MFTELGILKLIKRTPDRPFAPAMAMIGVKGGDRVLFCGAGMPDLAAEVGVITSLNGQTTVVARQEEGAARVEAAATAAGALVDFEDAPLTMLPFDDGAWDVAIIPGGLLASAEEAGPVLAEAVGVLRSGGRLLLFDRVSRPGLFGLWRNPVDSMEPAEAITARLSATGLRGVRLLAEVDGIRYFEGTKIK